MASSVTNNSPISLSPVDMGEQSVVGPISAALGAIALSSSKSHQGKLTSCNTKLTEGEYAEIGKYIDQNRETHVGKTIYCHSKEIGLPRSLSFYSDGTVYIHLNQVEDGSDYLVGKGGSKKAKYSLNYDTGEVFVRTTTEGNCEREIAFFDRTKDLPGVARLLHSQEFSSKNGFKTEMMMPNYANGSLASFQRKSYVESEKDESVVEFFASDVRKEAMSVQILETADQLHAKGLSHGDYSGSNIFLDENQNPFVGDFGLSRASACPYQQLIDLFFLNQIFLYSLGTAEGTTQKKVESRIRETLQVMSEQSHDYQHLGDLHQLNSLAEQMYQIQDPSHDLIVITEAMVSNCSRRE
jgi:serine/threonine protein kinase